MRTTRLCVLWAAVLVLLVRAGVRADEAEEKAVKAELAKLRGGWIAVSYESEEGKNLEVKAALVITGRSFDFWIGHGGVEGTIEINPAAKPKSLDFRVLRPGEKALWPGIYELQGNRLRIAFGDSREGKRPSSFDPKQDKKAGVFVFERVVKKKD